MGDQLQVLAAEIRMTLGGLDSAQTQLTPLHRPERWSVQQIVQHLNLTYLTTAKVLETRIEKGRPTQAKPSLVQHVAQFAIINLGRFPKGRKAPDAVTPFDPDQPRTGDELAQQAAFHLDQLQQLASAGQEIFGSRRAASHLILGPLSMSQWLTFHLVHGRHHLKQIRQIRKANGL